MPDKNYQAVMSRRNEIMKAAVGLDYSRFETGAIAFDYEGLMAAPGLDINKIHDIQRGFGVGDTPLWS